MPTITKSERKIVTQAFTNHYLNKLTNKQFIETRAFRSLYWDDEWCRRADAIQDMVAKSQIGTYSPEVNITVAGIEHPLHPQPFMLDLDITVSGRNLLWPRASLMTHFRPGFDAAVADQLHGAARAKLVTAMEIGLFKEVCTFVIDECTTHEAARFLFPPYLLFIRHALPGIARQIEDVKKVPNLPKRPFLMQEKIRHVIQYFAMHELLGTWEQPKQTFKTEEGVSEVMLSFTKEIVFEHASGQTVSLPVHT